MSPLPFEAFLAFRYLRPRRTFVSVITVISILGVLLGVAVLIVVISVMSGFDKEWRDSIIGFNAHMKVYREHGRVNDFEKVMKTISNNPEVVGVAPLIESLVVLETEPEDGESKMFAPVLIGVDQERQGSVSVLPTNIISGEFNLKRHGLVVGSELAKNLELTVGDRVAIYSEKNLQKMKKSRGKEDEEKIAPDEFVVRGIFDVGFNDFNKSIVVASLEDLQKMYDYPDNAVQLLQVKLRDPFRADLVAQQLESTFKGQFDYSTWLSENKSLFEALAVEKNMMFFLLFFIMIVAGFGIINCQITFVVQKTREIGILKSLGASNRQVLWIFLSQSVVVGVLGVGLGLALALLALHYRNGFLELMRNVTGIEILPATIYKVYDLPALTLPADVAIICGTAFVTCVLAGLFPAWKASRLQPVEALRYE